MSRALLTAALMLACALSAEGLGEVERSEIGDGATCEGIIMAAVRGGPAAIREGRRYSWSPSTVGASALVEDPDRSSYGVPLVPAGER